MMYTIFAAAALLMAATCSAEPTEYYFDIDPAVGSRVTKDYMDVLVNTFISFSPAGAYTLSSSEYANNVYTVKIEEAAAGTFPGAVCAGISSFPDAPDEVCYITAVRSTTATACTPSTSAKCKGVTYEMKHVKDLPADKTSLDLTIANAIVQIMNQTGKIFDFGGSTYDSNSRVYKPVIAEPTPGAFGTLACSYMENEGKCAFEYIKNSTTTFCETSKDDYCSAAFGFSPIAFLMSLFF